MVAAIPTVRLRGSPSLRACSYLCVRQYSTAIWRRDEAVQQFDFDTDKAVTQFGRQSKQPCHDPYWRDPDERREPYELLKVETSWGKRLMAKTATRLQTSV